jgi:hypothetical protein
MNKMLRMKMRAAVVSARRERQRMTDHKLDQREEETRCKVRGTREGGFHRELFLRTFISGSKRKGEERSNDRFLALHA